MFFVNLIQVEGSLGNPVKMCHIFIDNVQQLKLFTCQSEWVSTLVLDHSSQGVKTITAVPKQL